MKLKMSLILIFILNQFDVELIAAERVKHYFCTGSDSKCFPLLLNLIGSIHKTSFDQLGEIAVFDLGLTGEELRHLATIQKVSLHSVELTHPDILTQFKTDNWGKVVPGWYAWKLVVLKQALDLFPYVFWIDAGSTVLKPLNVIFECIDQHGYFLCSWGDPKVGDKLAFPINWGTTTYVKDAFGLSGSIGESILSREFVDAGIIGASHKVMNSFVMPLYNFTKDIRLFADDGSTPDGFGTGRHDQTVLSIYAYLNNFTVYNVDHTQKNALQVNLSRRNERIYITWNRHYVDKKTCLYRSRCDLKDYAYYTKAIQYRV